MKMHIDPTVIFRVPRFSYLAGLKDKWEELKISISHSSPDFFLQVQHLSYDDLSSQPDGIRHTIWKYFNRAKHRATPYASFAGVGTANFSNTNAELTLADEQVLHSFPDWSQVKKIEIPFSDLFYQQQKFFTNSSWYRVENDIRYIARSDNDYELSEIGSEELVLEVLSFFKVPRPLSDSEQIRPIDLSKDDFLTLLEDMWKHQLLIHEIEPNLIGEEYFKRTGIYVGEEKPVYMIAERSTISGKLPIDPFRYLPAMVEKLHELLPSYYSPQLDQFVDRFIQKFGEREIPIMVALDPELGIGYGDLESSVHNDPLTETLMTSAKNSHSTEDPQSTISLLFPALLKGGQQYIDLEQVQRPVKLFNDSLPNSLPILCSLSDGIVTIDHIGGCTSNMLSGRFSLASEQILSHCRNIADLEQKSNPEVQFFDISYSVGSGVVDNVNRRGSIYPKQLSILTYDTSTSPLALDDMMLSVRGKKLMITCAKNKKRLVPRMASAYNYTLSDLPLFRLLCDLQHQGIHKNLYIRLRDRLPGLSYYPKVIFRNIILSPQTWKVSANEIPQKSSSEVLLECLRSKGVSPIVKAGSADQLLRIDLCKEQDLEALLLLLKKQKSLYLEEASIEEKTGIFDEQGNPYHSQLHITLTHTSMIYPGIPREGLSVFRANKQEVVPPGGKWLYFEIYCHPHRSDEILTEIIGPFVKEHERHISKWFFIRYAENGNHIRFRMMLHSPASSHPLTAALSELLGPYLSSGIVSDLRLRSYKPETDRYGTINLPQIEDQFHKDSTYILELLKLGLSSLQKYKLCALLACRLQRAGMFAGDRFGKVIEDNMKGFAGEMGIGAEQFRAMNISYAEFTAMSIPVLGVSLTAMMKSVADHWRLVLLQYAPNEQQEIFSALYHMHVNRLFHAAQRAHETIIYYFLNKDLKREEALKEIKTL